MATNGNGNCTILWSTQSGRAKACARRVTRLVKEQSTLYVQSQSTFDELGWASLQSQETQLWVLLVSTTGDGEHCDSIQETWKQLWVFCASFAKQLNVVPLVVLYLMMCSHTHTTRRTRLQTQQISLQIPFRQRTICPILPRRSSLRSSILRGRAKAGRSFGATGRNSMVWGGLWRWWQSKWWGLWRSGPVVGRKLSSNSSKERGNPSERSD